MIDSGTGRKRHVITANLNGAQEGASYLEGRDAQGQVRRSVGPMPGLYVWKSGDGETASITTGESGEFEVTDGYPLYVQLRGPGLRVFHDVDPSTPTYESGDYAHWFSGPSFPPFYDEATGDPGSVSGQHNVFHQMRRGLKGFRDRGTVVNGVGAVGGDSGEIQVQTGYEASDMREALGDALEGKIRLSVAASLSSDVILHELAHLAVETGHAGVIGKNTLEEGVSEGLADFFACSINEDRYFSTGPDDLVDLDAEKKPTDMYPGQPLGDMNGDLIYDPADWGHYDNGPVIASILWDLKKDGLLDQTLIAAINRLEGHTPGKLYVALIDSGATAQSLWTAFSAHGVNLSGVAQGAGVSLEWFKHYGAEVSSYVVERSADQSFVAVDRLTPDPGKTSYVDASLSATGTYYYRVTPVDAQGTAVGGASNVAEVRFSGLMTPQNLHLVDASGTDASGGRTLTVAWETSLGGTVRSGYQLLRMEQDATWWEPVDPESGPIGATATVVDVKHPGEKKCWYKLRPYAVVQIGGQTRVDFGPASEVVEYPSVLDLVVVVQPYYPYYNYTAGYLRRYQKSLLDLLDALAGSEVPAGQILISSSGRDSGGQYPQDVAGDFVLAKTLVGRSAASGGWLDYSAPRTWRANRLDVGLGTAREHLEPWLKDPSHIRKALLFTNWFHYDPDDAGHVPPSTSARNWVAPFAAETDDPEVAVHGGVETASVLVRNPAPGTWQAVLDGSALAGAAHIVLHAYTDSAIRVDESVPTMVRPGEGFGFTATAGAVAGLRAPTLRAEFIRDTGKVYDIGQRVVNVQMTPQGASGLYRAHHTVAGYEGQLRYRLTLEGTDAAGNLVHRESDGALVVQGAAPTIEPVGPFGITAEPLPLIQARVRDDAAVQSNAIRLDGKALQCSYDAASGLLSGRSTTLLSAGEHTVEVTATDGIGQQATPEIWSFTVGPTLSASDPQGDDRGPGYYSYPTVATAYPAGSFDLLTFRVGHSAGAPLLDATGKEQIAITVGLRNTAGTVAQLNQVVDVYIDTDGIFGSGITALLPGRNALLRSQDAWEHVLTMGAGGAVLRTAAGVEQLVPLDYHAGSKTLTAFVPFADLGIEDPERLATWGYTVLVMGRDGLNGGGVREVTTLGGAHAFGGGAEGNVDPNIIDLLAPVGTTQEALLAGYSVPLGQRAVLSAYRFGGESAGDEMAPVLTLISPTGVWSTDPPTYSWQAQDDRALDAASFTLAVDGVAVDGSSLVVSGTQRNKTATYTPAGPLGAGTHRLTVGAADVAGNHGTRSGVFAVGAAAQIARLCGRERAGEMALGGSCRIEGTAVGGAYELETNTDSVAWTSVAQGNGPVVEGLLGEWALADLAEGQRQVRLRVAASGGDLTDVLTIVVDNTAPQVALEQVGPLAVAVQQEVKGAVEVRGGAEDAHLAGWTLEAGEGKAPSTWRLLNAGAQGQETGALLAAWDTASMIDFDWTLRLKAMDAAGNETVRTAAVHVDNTVPQASISAPVDGATVVVNGRVAVEGEVFDSRLESWALEYGVGAAPSIWAPIASGASVVYRGAIATWDTAGLAPGTHTLRLTGRDRAGSQTLVTQSVTLTSAPLARIAGIGPLTLPSPAGGEGNFVNGSVEVRGTVGFAAGGSYVVEASADGVAWTPIGSGTTTVADGLLATWETGAGAYGAYTVRVTATEAANTSASDQVTVTVDNTAPVAAVTSPAEGAAIVCAGYVPIGTNPGTTAAHCRVEIQGTASDAHLASSPVR